jgi:hypothetical protein
MKKELWKILLPDLFLKNDHKNPSVWLIKKIKKFGLDFTRGMSLQNFSSETLSSSSKSGSHAGPLSVSTGSSRGADDQRKKLGLDFGLRITCAKFHPKILTLSVSNPGAPKKQLLDKAD